MKSFSITPLNFLSSLPRPPRHGLRYPGWSHRSGSAHSGHVPSWVLVEGAALLRLAARFGAGSRNMGRPLSIFYFTNQFFDMYIHVVYYYWSIYNVANAKTTREMKWAANSTEAWVIVWEPHLFWQSQRQPRYSDPSDSWGDLNDAWRKHHARNTAGIIRR